MSITILNHFLVMFAATFEHFQASGLLTSLLIKTQITEKKIEVNLHMNFFDITWWSLCRGTFRMGEIQSLTTSTKAVWKVITKTAIIPSVRWQAPLHNTGSSYLSFTENQETECMECSCFQFSKDNQVSSRLEKVISSSIVSHAEVE